MERHIKVVGILFIALGALSALVALMLFIAVFSGLLPTDQSAVEATTIAGGVIAALLLLISCASIIGGVGLLQRRSWARPLCIFLAALNLFNFPLGSVVGIYAIWTLLKPETRAILAPRPDVWAHLH